MSEEKSSLDSDADIIFMFKELDQKQYCVLSVANVMYNPRYAINYWLKKDNIVKYMCVCVHLLQQLWRISSCLITCVILSVRVNISSTIKQYSSTWKYINNITFEQLGPCLMSPKQINTDIKLSRQYPGVECWLSWEKCRYSFKLCYSDDQVMPLM